MLLVASTAAAQPTNPPTPLPHAPHAPHDPHSPTNPIDCWWKTDPSAVRVGEHFRLTLTCAVLDTNVCGWWSTNLPLHRRRLHRVPFDIVDGQRFRDIQNAPRRFFQYQYTMRVLGEEFFGRILPCPGCS